MHTQIRLAERQGLLVGHGLSLVQAKGIYLMELLDVTHRAEEADKRLREALLSTGQYELGMLFPELTESEANTRSEIEQALESEDSVSYDFSEAHMDPAEAERLLASLLGEHSSGSVNGDQAAWNGGS